MSRQYARWLAPAGVFAVVLGIAVAVTQSGNDRTPRRLPLSLQGANRAEGAATDAKLAAPGYWGAWGRYTISGDLGDLPDSGPAYRLPGGRLDVAVVRRLAAALGLSGEPVRIEQGWKVGSTGRVLLVHDAAGNPWTYGEEGLRECGPAADCAVGVAHDVAVSSPPIICVSPVPDDTRIGTEPAPAPSAGSGSGSGSSAEPAPQPSSEPKPEATPDPGCKSEPPPSPPPAPSEDDTLEATRTVLRATGQDAAAARLSVEEGWGTRTGVADPQLGGLPTWGWSTRVTVDVHRTVVHANGWLGTPASEGSYPLLTPQQAIDRTAGGPQPLPAVRCDAETPECTAEPPAREVTAARLGLLWLSSYTEPQESYLVPAWLLTVRDAPAEEPLLALPDDYLASPSPEPVPEPDGSGKPEPDATRPAPSGEPGSSTEPVPPDSGAPLPPEPASAEPAQPSAS